MNDPFNARLCEFAGGKRTRQHCCLNICSYFGRLLQIWGLFKGGFTSQILEIFGHFWPKKKIKIYDQIWPNMAKCYQIYDHRTKFMTSSSTTASTFSVGWKQLGTRFETGSRIFDFFQESESDSFLNGMKVKVTHFEMVWKTKASYWSNRTVVEISLWQKIMTKMIIQNTTKIGSEMQWTV